ncbi:MAG: NAD(P)H-hydrate dehydratase [Gammaproteobacteria bacterium]|nr:NAD(P)H-hydrate dehydratase [Gammaproteobacteria bacterium]
MRRITSATAADLFDVATTRRIEQTAAATLGPHVLMQRAGLAVARLVMAKAPHARLVWIACGPGNNGGDGFEAAAQLKLRGFNVVVTRIGDEHRLPADARASLQRAKDASVVFRDAPPDSPDLVIDALLGIGASRPVQGQMAEWLERLYRGDAPVIAVDTPSGLDVEHGTTATDLSRAASDARRPGRTCLSLLTLKPGLFTAQGRDAAGEVWFDDLGIAPVGEAPTARLCGLPAAFTRPHASHKGSYGDVAVVGGAPGMGGAALLAASAALSGGAGRVFLCLLDSTLAALDPVRPELMFRRPDSLDLGEHTVVCGCGGGSAVAALLPRVLARSRALVLDADALNAVAKDAALRDLLAARGRRGQPTVLTPHPLEAARLLETDAADIQNDRLAAARRLVAMFGATVILKGSGTLIAAPDRVPAINLTGNARLATAGTGDVLAGMVGSALAAAQTHGQSAFDAAVAAVWRHGHLADTWPNGRPLTAGALALA